MGADTQLKVGGPDVVSVEVCDACLATSRWKTLRQKHYAKGGLCSGTVTSVRYVREVKS